MRRLRPDAAAVFLMPPSMAELERRLRARGTNDEDDIQLRLKNAREEMAAAGEFDFVIVNDDLDRAVSDLEQILAPRDGQEEQG
jgi:guanylate kinase